MVKSIFSSKVKIKNFILFVFLVLFNQSLFAVLPHPACTTICSTKDSLKNGRQCIQLGSKQLYIRKAGAGSPTVIFSSGTGISADTWFSSGIAEEVAKKATVLVYDRLYTFNSCQKQQ